MINIYEPYITLKDRLSVFFALSNKYIGLGDKTAEFVEKFKKFNNHDRSYYIPTQTGTDAIFFIMKLLAMRYKVSYDVLVPSISYLGNAHAVKNVGWNVVLTDVDKNSGNINLAIIKKFVTPKTKAIILMYYNGNPINDIANIRSFCSSKNIILIEDCALAVTLKQGKFTAGYYGDYAYWSFDLLKAITTIEGGMIKTNSENDVKTFKKMLLLGLSNEIKIEDKIKKTKWWKEEPQLISTRSLLSNINSTLGISQLKNIYKIKRIKNKLLKYYYKYIVKYQLDKYFFYKMEIDKESGIPLWFYIRLMSEKVRNDLSVFLKDNDVYTNFKYNALHTTTMYNNAQLKISNSQIFNDTVLCLPLHPNLKEKDIKYICNKIKVFFDNYEGELSLPSEISV